MAIFVRTIYGFNLILHDYNEEDTILEFKQKCWKNIEKENKPYLDRLKSIRKKMLINFLIYWNKAKEKYKINKKDKMDTIIFNENPIIYSILDNINCKYILGNIIEYLFPYRNIRVDIQKKWDYSPNDYKLRVIVNGREYYDNQKCIINDNGRIANWYTINGIFIVFILKNKKDRKWIKSRYYF